MSGPINASRKWSASWSVWEKRIPRAGADAVDGADGTDDGQSDEDEPTPEVAADDEKGDRR